MAFLLLKLKARPPPSSLSQLPPLFSLLYKPLSSAADDPPFSAATDDPAFSAADSKLLDNLHSLILDHHATHAAAPPLPPTTDLTIPSLSAAFSVLCSSPPSPLLARHLLERCSSLRHGAPMAEALAFFNWWISSSPSSDPSSLTAPFTEMIDLCGKLRHFGIAWHLLDKMRSLDVPVTNQVFAVLIRRYVRADLPEDAANAFQRMSDYGCEPDPHTFSSLLHALSKKRLAAEAQSLFDSLKHRFPPDVVVYSSLIHAWCRAGRLDKAEWIFAEMAADGVPPNVSDRRSLE